MLIKIGCGGVCLGNLHPMMQPVLKAVSEIWVDEVVITETWGGTHLDYSWHPLCRALDFRLPKSNVQLKVEAARRRLGRNYDVVLEGDHVHIEFEENRK